MPRPNTEKKYQRVIVLRERGMGALQVAELTGYSIDLVYRVIRELRPDLAFEGRVAHEREFINSCRELWDNGFSASEIARRSGVTKNAIIGLAHRNNFTARRSPIRRPLDGLDPTKQPTEDTMTNDDMNAVRIFLTTKRDALTAQLVSMQGRIKELDNLIAELAAPGNPLSPAKSVEITRKPKPAPQGNMLIEALTVAGPDGATYKMLSDYCVHHGFPTMGWNAVSSRLSQFKKRGKVSFQDGNWSLKSANGAH